MNLKHVADGFKVFHGYEFEVTAVEDPEFEGYAIASFEPKPGYKTGNWIGKEATLRYERIGALLDKYEQLKQCVQDYCPPCAGDHE
jgi:hypothetical protein